ncbi:MAG TPA: hypothetical protein VGE10_11065 [Zeimonas sp.]
MLAEQIHQKLAAIWGTRFLAMWRGADMRQVFATWDESLSHVDPERIQRALVDCQNAENPPTLPEFLRLCRAQPASSDRGAPQLTFVGTPTTREQARANLERVNRMLARIGQNTRRDPLFWARRPLTARAMHLLARGAIADHRLRTILLEHVDDGGERCRSDEAVQALLALMQAGVIDRLRGIQDVPAYDPEREPDSRAPAHFEGAEA